MSDDAPPAFEPQSLASVTSADTDNNESAPTANGGSLKDSMVNSKVCHVIINPFPFLHRLISLQTPKLYTQLPSLIILPDTAAAMNTVSNHPITQSTKETITNGINSIHDTN
jgi:hypothetical protein